MLDTILIDLRVQIELKDRLLAGITTKLIRSEDDSTDDEIELFYEGKKHRIGIQNGPYGTSLNRYDYDKDVDPIAMLSLADWPHADAATVARTVCDHLIKDGIKPQEVPTTLPDGYKIVGHGRTKVRFVLAPSGHLIPNQGTWPRDRKPTDAEIISDFYRWYFAASNKERR